MKGIYPIGGGKGGVGKSFIAASLGALISKRGKKVVLIDLDLGASNLHTILGIKSPKNGLNAFLDRTAKTLESVAVSTTIPNLYFISSLNCSMEIANLLYAQKLKLGKAIQKLPFDYIFLDLGTGTHFNTLDFFLTSKKGVLICTPEPTSIENSFRFIQAVYFRILKQLIKRHAFNSTVKQALGSVTGKPVNTPDIIEIILKYDPDKEQLLRDRFSGYDFNLILNQFRKNIDPTLGYKIETVCNRHFYSDFQFLGNVRYDGRIHDAVFSKTLYVHRYPHTQSSGDLKKIVEKITSKKPSISSVTKRL